MSTAIGIAISGNVFQTRAGLGSSGASLLLDEYGTNNKLAYSVRKLRTAYTGACMRVRNSLSFELDIGFDSSGNLDESALLTHCGAGDGFVIKWYDQSGNGGDVEQGVKTNQPQIVLSGAVLTETVFGLAGVGRMLVEAIYARDYPIIQTFTVMIAVTYMLINLIVDISYGFLDPRVRLE